MLFASIASRPKSYFMYIYGVLPVMCIRRCVELLCRYEGTHRLIVFIQMHYDRQV